MNKTIYINNENREQVIEASEKESINSIVNKALKYYFSGKVNESEKKPANDSGQSWTEIIQQNRKKKA